MIQKNVVIDFDRTIGYFYQFNMVCKYISSKYPSRLQCPVALFSSMEQVFRPNIFKVMKMIIYARENRLIDRFILYTKNSNDRLIRMVIDYIRYKLGILCDQEVFDIVLLCVKRREKSISEVLKKHLHETGTDIVEQQICVMDDKVYEKMIEDNVFYIYCVPYVFEYTKKEVINIVTSVYEDVDITEFGLHLSKYCDTRKYKTLSRKNHCNLSKNILTFLLTFINHKF